MYKSSLVIIGLVAVLAACSCAHAETVDCEQTPHVPACSTAQHGDPTCVVTGWSPWSACSASCGEHGLQQRVRTLESKHTPQQCSHLALNETRQCNLRECPRDCQLTQWSNWSACSASCGGGQQMRVRDVERSSKGPLNAICGPLQEWEECGADWCQGGCDFSAWGPWSECTAPCGSGQQVRHRSLKSSGNATFCGQLEQKRACNTHLCPVDCQESEWGPWSVCSQRCGGGFMSRVRHVIRQSENGGKMCGDLVMHTACNDEPCPKDCVVGDWSIHCPETCDGSTVLRTRKVIQQATDGGKQCPALQENVPCSQYCHSGLHGLVKHNDHADHNSNNNGTKIECHYSNWTDWTPCHGVKCGNGGTTSRTRTVLNVDNDHQCKDTHQEMACDEAQCATDCVLSEWSEWSTCSNPCGEGKMHRTRTLVSDAINGGHLCPEMHQVRDCNVNTCDKTKLACQSGFTEWSPCSKSCGGGLSMRSRPADSGCGFIEEYQTCNTQPCTPWVLSPWSDWSECNAPCNGGYRQRTRTVVQAGVDPQVPQLVETEPCNDMACHPASVTEWSDWSECNEPCGTGVKQRVRVITEMPLGPQFAQLPPLVEYASCNVQHCPIDCVMSTWSDWSKCNEKCVQRRVRVMESPPLYGGAACPTKLEETQMCTPCNPHGYGWERTGWNWVGTESPQDTVPVGSQDAPKTCDYSEWSDWGDCADNCLQTRSRRIQLVHTSGEGETSGTDGSFHQSIHLSQTVKCGRFVKQQRRCPSCRSQLPPDHPAATHAPNPQQQQTGAEGAPNGHSAYSGKWSWDHVISTGAKPQSASSPPAKNQQDVPSTVPQGCEYSAWSAWSDCEDAAHQVRTRQVTVNIVSMCGDFVRQRRPCGESGGGEGEGASKYPPRGHHSETHEWGWDHAMNTDVNTARTTKDPVAAHIAAAERGQGQVLNKHVGPVDGVPPVPVTMDDPNSVKPQPTSSPKDKNREAAAKALSNPIITDGTHVGKPITLGGSPPTEATAQTVKPQVGGHDQNKPTTSNNDNSAPSSSTHITESYDPSVNDDAKKKENNKEEDPKAAAMKVNKENKSDKSEKVLKSKKLGKVVDDEEEEDELAKAAVNKNIPKELKKLLSPPKEPVPASTPSVSQVLNAMKTQVKPNKTEHMPPPCPGPTCECKGEDWSPCVNHTQTRILASVNENKTCVHTQEMRKCPHFPPAPLNVNPCAPHPCEPSEQCIPDRKWCVTTPCLQHKCVAIKCEYKAPERWSACQPTCGCRGVSCPKFKRRVKVVVTKHPGCKSVTEKVACGSVSLLETLHSRVRRGRHKPTEDLDSLTADIDLAVNEEHRAEHLTSVGDDDENRDSPKIEATEADMEPHDSPSQQLHQQSKSHNHKQSSRSQRGCWK